MMLPLLAATGFVSVGSGILAEANSGDPSASGFATAAIIAAIGTAAASIIAAVVNGIKALRKQDPIIERRALPRTPEEMRAERDRLDAELEQMEGTP